MFNIEHEIRTGEPIQAGDLEITPQSSVYKIMLRRGHGGLIWNRPKAVIVRTAQGQESTLPVVDATRQVIWGMLAGAIIGVIMIILIGRTRLHE